MYEIPKEPVRLNGRLYDLQTLLKLNPRRDPFERDKTFTMKDIQHDWSTKERFEELINNQEDNYKSRLNQIKDESEKNAKQNNGYKTGNQLLKMCCLYAVLGQNTEARNLREALLERNLKPSRLEEVVTKIYSDEPNIREMYLSLFGKIEQKNTPRIRNSL